MLAFEEIRLEAPFVESLQWTDEGLTDWVNGDNLYRLDGTKRESRMILSYHFDSALVSPSGRFTVVYEKLGTKGVVLEGRRIVREISRSFYNADSYEYPMALFTLPDGDEAIIHCPEEYNCLEIERLSTGERLSTRELGKSPDFFHSRLIVDKSNTLLLDIGWVWHPWLTVNLYDLNVSIEQSHPLDEPIWSPDGNSEFANAAFVDDLIMVSTTSDMDNFEEKDNLFTENSIGILDVQTRTWLAIYKIRIPIGLFFPLSSRYIVSFYDYPKVIDLHDGSVIQSWEQLKTGKQEICIVSSSEHFPPPLAMDTAHARFAVWHDKQIHIIQFDREELGRHSPPPVRKDNP